MDQTRPNAVLIGTNAFVPLAVGLVSNVATSTNNVLVWVAALAVSVLGAATQWLLAARTGDPSTGLWRIAAGLLVALSASIVVLTALTTAGVRHPAPPRLINEVDSYSLTSSDGFCPTEDKIDLDSGQPGHGSQPQLGEYDTLPEGIQDKCRHEGGLAELILEDDELHGPDGRPTLVLVDGGHADFAACRTAVDQTPQSTSRVALSAIAAGDRLCVRTDIGNVALVEIKDVDPSLFAARITIAFTVWQP